jgi:hypothetical protein
MCVCVCCLPGTAQGDQELAADRANYWQFVSRVTGKELRQEGLDELVRAGSITSEERDIMSAQQEKMRRALSEDESTLGRREGRSS